MESLISLTLYRARGFRTQGEGLLILLFIFLLSYRVDLSSIVGTQKRVRKREEIFKC